jgi:hypothetical protein
MFRNDFEAVGMIRVKPEEFVERIFQGEINLVGSLPFCVGK